MAKRSKSSERWLQRQRKDYFVRQAQEGGHIFREQLGLTSPKRHWTAAATTAALHLSHEEHSDRQDDQYGEARQQQLSPNALTFLF